MCNPIDKAKEYIEYKKKFKTHKIRVTDSKGNTKTVKATVEADAPLCRSAKDIIDDFFSNLPNLRD